MIRYFCGSNSTDTAIMNKLFILFLLTAAPGAHALAQGTSKKETLKRINTLEQAQSFLEKAEPSKGAIGRFNSIIDSVEYKEITRDYKIGDVFFGKKLTYKILKKEKEVIYRCQYIHIDGNVYSKAQADSIRSQIISKYHSGIAFDKLAAQHSSATAGKKGGDSGWFHKEKMGETMYRSLEEHSKGQLFTVDDPASNSYYVVVKSHNELQADSWVYITLR